MCTPPHLCRSLPSCNLTGTLLPSIGNFVNITLFDVANNPISGTIPQEVGAWTQLTALYVYGTDFYGAPLPLLPFANLGTCELFDSSTGSSDSFTCPWPTGATEHCKKYVNSVWIPITDSDCVFYSCKKMTGQCAVDPHGTQTAQDCIQTCTQAPTPVPTTPKPTPKPTTAPTPAPGARSPAAAILGVACALLGAALLFTVRRGHIRKQKRGAFGRRRSDLEAPLLGTSATGVLTARQRLDGAQRHVADLARHAEETAAAIAAAEAEAAAAQEALAAEAKVAAAATAVASASAARAAVSAASSAVAAAVAAERAVNEASLKPRVFTPRQMEEATGSFAARCLLDEGKFSAVYRGRLQPSGREVAIKLLKPEAAAYVPAQKKHEKFVGVGSFRNELEVLRKCRHQNIVQLLGYCLSGGSAGIDDVDESKGGGGGAAAAPGPQRQCLVLEWMAGGSLRKRLDGSGTALTAEQRFDVASDVARGLEFMHISADPPIIHQDVKSDNVLLDEVGGRIIAKVADFGTARSVPELLQDGIDHHSTQMVIGTKPYQPPEYYQSGHTSDKTDTYAFGVILCELLTGLPPADNKGEVLTTTMSDALAAAKRKLPPLLDVRLGGGVWPKPRAIALGRIAGHCIEMKVTDRCLLAEKLPELDAIAGRVAVVRAGRG